MNDIAWLEALAKKTDYDIEINEIIKQQPIDIQMAYKSNDSTTLSSILGNSDRFACKNTIFQY